MKLENCQLINITGGAVSITSGFLNSIARMIESVMDVGRSLGTAIRMIYSKRAC